MILARAGVERLELMDSPEYVVQELAFGEMLPAPAQGAWHSDAQGRLMRKR